VSTGSNVFGGDNHTVIIYLVSSSHLITDLKCLFIVSFIDSSMAEQSDSTETHSSNDDNISDNTPTDQSETFNCDDGQTLGVAESALQDGQKKSEPAAVSLKESFA